MLKLVILKNFYSQTNNPEATDLFGKIMSMKIGGYRRFYQYGVLPVSTHDFICDHISVCVEKDGELMPVISYKSTPLVTCGDFNLGFPILDLFKSELFPDHKESIERHLKENEGKVIHYDSSLTVDAKLVKEFNVDVFENIKAMHTYYHRDILPKGHFTFAAGTVRFKMHRYYKFWGYEELSKDNKELSPVDAQYVEHDQTILYTMDRPSSESLFQLKSHENQWESISVWKAPEEIKVAA